MGPHLLGQLHFSSRRFEVLARGGDSDEPGLRLPGPLGFHRAFLVQSSTSVDILLLRGQVLDCVRAQRCEKLAHRGYFWASQESRSEFKVEQLTHPTRLDDGLLARAPGGRGAIVWQPAGAKNNLAGEQAESFLKARDMPRRSNVIERVFDKSRSINDEGGTDNAHHLFPIH